jgi:hypothetical protein
MKPKRRAGRLLRGASLLSFLAFSGISEAKAPPTEEERLTEASLSFQNARGGALGDLNAYIALREIWSSWRSVDPLRVEHALMVAAADESKSAPLREYAAKLAAYGRLRRGDLHSAQAHFKKSGYITDWLIVGPFDNEGKTGFEQVFGPDANPEEPLIPGRAFSGKERPVRYRVLPDVFRYGWVDFGYLQRPSTHICAHATTFLTGTRKDDEKKSRKVTLWVGSDGAHRVQFNGQTAIEEDAYRGFDTARHSATVLLRPGQNRLRLLSRGWKDRGRRAGRRPCWPAAPSAGAAHKRLLVRLRPCA